MPALGFSTTQQGAPGHLQPRKSPGMIASPSTKGPLQGQAGMPIYVPHIRAAARARLFTVIPGGLKDSFPSSPPLKSNNGNTRTFEQDLACAAATQSEKLFFGGKYSLGLLAFKMKALGRKVILYIFYECWQQ